MKMRNLLKCMLAAAVFLYSSFSGLPVMEAHAAGLSDAVNNTVNVAVFDGGFNPSDAAISSSVRGCYNAVTDKEGAESLSSVDHGTSCAKILKSTADEICSNLGITGNVNLYLVQVDAEGSYESYWESLKKGIEYALEKGCRVVSISLSDTKSNEEIQQAITDAAGREDGSILFVASGGNSGGSEYRYPASYYNVVSVSPLLQSGSGYVISGSATHNDMIDIAAPGSTASAATPYAAGAAAVMFQINPSLTAMSAVSILGQKADDAGEEGIDNYYGWGIINPYAAAEDVVYRMERGHN